MENITKKQKTMRLILKMFIAAVLLLIMVFGGYLAYFTTAYYRIGDKSISVDRGSEGEQLYLNRKYNMLSWNIGFAAYSSDYSFFMDGGKYSRALSKQAVLDNLNGIKKTVAEAADFYGTNKRFDIMCFQEVDIDGDRSYHVDEYDQLKSEFSNYWSTFVQNYDSPFIAFPIFSPHGKNKSGMGTFSVFPMQSAKRKQLAVESGFSKYLDLDRCISINRIPTRGGKDLVIINLHLTAYSSDGKIADEQLIELFDVCKSEIELGNYVICAGDFNKDVLGNSSEVFGISTKEYNWAKPIKKELIEASGMQLIAPTGSKDYNIPSCRNADAPYHDGQLIVTVDGFLTSSNVEVVSSAVYNAKFEYSDHNPVCLSFKLK